MARAPAGALPAAPAGAPLHPAAAPALLPAAALPPARVALQRRVEQDAGGRGGLPAQRVRADLDTQRFLNLLHVLIHLGPVNGQHQLVVRLLPDEAEQHEGQCDVVRVEGGVRAELLDRDVAAAAHPRQVLQADTLPVGVVAHPAQVRQRLLRRPRLLLHLGQQVREVYQHPTVSLALAVRHRHDARHVVLLQAVLLFAEVPHQVVALPVILSENIKQERFHVVVKSLVIKEELDEETEVLTIDLVGVAVHLEHGHPVLAVDFEARRMAPGALADVSFQDRAGLHVLKAKLAEEELWQAGVLLRVGRAVPGGDVVLPELDHLRGPGAVEAGAAGGRGGRASHRSGSRRLGGSGRLFSFQHGLVLSCQEGAGLLLALGEKLDILLRHASRQGSVQSLLVFP